MSHCVVQSKLGKNLSLTFILWQRYCASQLLATIWIAKIVHKFPLVVLDKGCCCCPNN